MSGKKVRYVLLNSRLPHEDLIDQTPDRLELTDMDLWTSGIDTTKEYGTPRNSRKAGR